jgi:penicillin-binding protein 2
MALPPGSTFKTVTALALLDSQTVKPDEPFECQGYLHRPDRQRCELFIRQGIGHGPVTLSDALMMSCNVYFFHFAEKMGPRPLIDWAERLGFGHPTGVDLPGEASGALPSPELQRTKGTKWRVSDTQLLAIGQGTLTATPLQIVRMMAAVANGGRIVTPRIRGQGTGDGERGAGEVAFRSGGTLRSVREGLRRVVSDPRGTGHATVYLESTAIAGKTGTAEIGEEHESHAWFAGYAPADAPKFAFVIVLEHGGDAATAASPLAKRLVLRMEQLGLL